MSGGGAPFDLSVVIPTWNGAARIVPTLESLARQSMSPTRFELVVVDDGGIDDLGRVVREFADRHPDLQVRYVRIDHSGVNAARNAGIVNSSKHLVMLIDDDEDVPPGHLALAVDLIAGHPERPGVGGPAKLKDAGFRTCSSCHIGEASLPIDGAGPTERLLGGNMVVRREVFEEFGLFDESISGRGDETEWFHRVGGSFWYDERLFVWHRRDHLTVRTLLATGFRQGRSVPIAAERIGEQPWRPSATRLARYLAHGISKRCTNGVLQESRELGSLTTWVRMQVLDQSRRRDKSTDGGRRR